MSRKEIKELPSIVEQELALKVYIDALLIETSTEQELATPENEPIEALVLPEDAVTAGSQSGIESVSAQPVEEVGEEPFECLMFQVAGGLQLSVPLVRLNGILPWAGECTSLPGHAEWFLGLVSHRGKQVKAIDIASFVIPENHQAREGLSGERKFKHLILINDGRYGIACDELGDMMKLNHEDVRWRSDRSSRPWLAGTVIDKMCALIDIDQFVLKLKEGITLDDI